MKKFKNFHHYGSMLVFVIKSSNFSIFWEIFQRWTIFFRKNPLHMLKYDEITNFFKKKHIVIKLISKKLSKDPPT